MTARSSSSRRESLRASASPPSVASQSREGREGLGGARGAAPPGLSPRGLAELAGHDDESGPLCRRLLWGSAAPLLSLPFSLLYRRQRWQLESGTADAAVSSSRSRGPRKLWSQSWAALYAESQAGIACGCRDLSGGCRGLGAKPLRPGPEQLNRSGGTTPGRRLLSRLAFRGSGFWNRGLASCSLTRPWSQMPGALRARRRFR